MDKPTDNFNDFLTQFGELQSRSMFGGIGYFESEAMYALISNDRYYLRGGKDLNQIFTDLGCTKYRHVKKQSTVTVNYYDVTNLLNQQYELLCELTQKSKAQAVKYRQDQHSFEGRRLRDLPNLNFTLERMLKKSGVRDVASFIELGAVEVFKLVQETYGTNVDSKTLLKFSGAINTQHWELISETEKQQLLRACC